VEHYSQIGRALLLVKQILSGAVGRAVVDDDDLLLADRLARPYLIENFGDGADLVVDRDDDRDGIDRDPLPFPLRAQRCTSPLPVP